MLQRLSLCGLLVLAMLAGLQAQDTREITRDTSYVRWVVSETDTAWYFSSFLTYADGSTNNVENLRLGDTSAAKVFLINRVLEKQRQYSRAIGIVANNIQTSEQTTLVSAQLTAVTGANYGQNIGLLFGDQLMGRYTVQVSGQPSFIGDIVRLSSGSMRLRRADNPATEWQITMWTQDCFRVTNLPGASGNIDVAYRNLNSAGKRRYSNSARTVVLQYRGPTPQG
jgi:hypothetical protein